MDKKQKEVTYTDKLKVVLAENGAHSADPISNCEFGLHRRPNP